MEHVHPVARAEARDDVADRVDEHVPHVQRPRGVREHLEDVALRLHRLVRDLERLRVRPDALPLLLDRTRVVPVHRHSHSSRGTKKPLAREAPRERPRLSPRSFPGLCKKLLHEPKTVPGKIQRCSSSFPTSARVESGELALGGVPRVRARGAVRDAARRLLRGDAPRPGARAARGGRERRSRLLRDEGVRERRGAPAPARGGGRRRRRVLGRARLRAGRRASPATSSSSTATTRTRRSCARPPAEGAPVVLDAPDEAELAAAAGVERVLVRVTLGVDADTHEAIVTGHHGSKFGLPPDGGAGARRGRARARARRARAARPRRLAAPRLHRAGRDDPRLAAFAATCRDALGWEARVADLGGGFGIRHHPDDDVPDAAGPGAAAAVATARAAFAVGGARAHRRSGSSRAARSSVARASRSTASAPSSASPSGPGSRSTAACPTTRGRSSTTRGTRR